MGEVKVWLGSLAYLVDVKSQLEIIDYRGVEMGRMNIEVVPCDSKGNQFVYTLSTYFIQYFNITPSTLLSVIGGQGGAVVTHSPPTSEISLTSSGKVGCCMSWVGSFQYRILTNYMYRFPLPFQLQVSQQ